MTELALPVLLSVLACGPSAAPTPDRPLPENERASQPEPPEAEPPATVHDIDWKNRTSHFPSEDQGGDPLLSGDYSVADGVYTGKFDTALVFATRDNAVVLIGSVPGGDRASGGLKSLSVVDGKIVTQRWMGTAACCAENIQFETWTYGKTISEDASARKLAPVND